MSVIVMKFGGSCISDAAAVKNAAKIIADEYEKGNSVVAVASAQGDVTDKLIRKASEISLRPPKRELDVLMSAGEQLSVALLAMAVSELGFPCVTLLGWQAGIVTNSVFGHARIRDIDPDRIKKELSKKNIVLVAGFQGVDRKNNMTTLGRGGSDTTAVSLAAALNAEKCQIYSKIDGIYTADPAMVPDAVKLKEIDYDCMQELSFLGVKVLNPRAVELAKKYGVVIEVKSAFRAEIPGTFVKEDANMEKMLISGVTKKSDVARISVCELEDAPGAAYGIFELLSKNDIQADIITQSLGKDGLVDVSFCVSGGDADEAARILEESGRYGENNVLCDKDVAKISVVGVGMESHPGVGIAIFEALSGQNINIQMITSSELRFSVIVKKEEAEKAVAAIHAQFRMY
ncbi:MAG: aspartate kinase [Clostridia bacterium]|nr:aspartate kinase [Clostridia bacterium]